LVEPVQRQWRLSGLAVNTAAPSAAADQLKKADRSALTQEQAERVATLSELCTAAADHVAQARMALFSEHLDTRSALDHLDKAIGCLRGFTARARRTGSPDSEPKLQSA
jgi:uncharacterized protein (DUF2384 family)